MSPFTKTLTLTATPTTLADLVSGVTNGTGSPVDFRGKAIIAGGTVTLTTASGSASLPTGSVVDLQGPLKAYSASGNNFTITLVGQADAQPANVASDLEA